MARSLGQRTGKDLNWTQIKNLKKVGLHRAADRLYVQVSGRNAKSWISRLRYGAPPKNHDIGLGPIDLVSFADAKGRVIELRKIVAAGGDPTMHRKPEVLAQAKTFRLVAEDYITAMSPGWTGRRTEGDCRSMLIRYAYPVIGDLAVDKITVNHVLQILSPIWATKTTAADKVREYIRRIWDAAKAKGWTNGGTNPAIWAGNLSALLPPKRRVHRGRSHASLPFPELAALITEMKAAKGMPILALRFAILTGGRSHEVMGAIWSEMDLDAAQWNIPPERMKSRVAHRVPLSNAALNLLRDLPRLSDLVFGKMGHDAMRKGLTALGRTVVDEDGFMRPITPHGFRSTFMMWGELVGKYPQLVLDMSLAHATEDAVLRAYQRASGQTVIEARAECMEAWSRFVAA